MNEKKLSRPLISLIVSIALIIVGIAGSFILQTNSGKTTIRNVTIESESGHTLNRFFSNRKRIAFRVTVTVLIVGS